MKVFILTSGDYDGYKLVDVFTDEELANTHADRLRKDGVSNVEVNWKIADPELEPFTVYHASYVFHKEDGPGAKPVLREHGIVGVKDEIPDSAAFYVLGTKYIGADGYGASEMEARDNLWAAIDQFRAEQAAA